MVTSAHEGRTSTERTPSLMRAKLAAGALGAAAIVAGLAAPAMAAPGTGTVNGSSNPVLNVPAGGGAAVVNTTVAYSGTTAGQPIFITTCRKAGNDPTFAGYAAECDVYSELNFNNASGSGSQTYPIAVNDPNAVGGFFFCKTSDGPGDLDLGGGTIIEGDPTCFVRVVFGSPNAEADAFYVPLILTVVPVPESPVNVLLPLGAAAGVAAAAYLALRNRRPAMA